MTKTMTCAVWLSLLAAVPADQPQDSLESIERTRGGRHWIDAKTDPPKSPEESRRCFQIEDGMQIELFAAEPLVIDPVSIAFDERGRMFVVEYGDYPSGPPEGEPPLSRVVLLEDTNGDGRPDRRHVFADRLNFAHSLMPWKQGILVGAQTEIVFLKDTDGDNRADVREVLFRGFQPAHPQMQIGNPRWGFDNWIYLNYGPGEIVRVANPKTPLKMSRSEFRFHPQTMEFGPASGRGQFGNTFDNWGNRFFCSNRNPIMTPILSWSESRRNPYVTVPQLYYDVSPAGGDARVYPRTAMKSNYLSHAGTHTSACGTTAYRGDLWEPEFQHSVFVCEPIGHLVTRSIVQHEGLQLVARRAQPKADFLTSTDTWCRPVNLANGPDGALYVADMYRLWVEHPKFLPEDVGKRLDWRAGDDRGRIWRITPKNAAPRSFDPPETTEELMALLSDPSGWCRHLGQRLLVERQAVAATPALAQLLADSDNPLTRLHALWTLDGIGKLTHAQLASALDDSDASVRNAAVRLAGERLDRDPSLLKAIVKRASDKDVRVRFQLALALGATNHETGTETLARLAIQDGTEPHFALAILTSAHRRSGDILDRLCRNPRYTGDGDAARIDLVRELATVVGARGDQQELAGTLRMISTAKPLGAWWQTAALSGLAAGLPRHRGALGSTSLSKLINAPPQPLASFGEPMREVLRHAQQVAVDREKPIEARLAAIELLGYQPFAQTAEAFEELLSPTQPDAVQRTSLEAIGKNIDQRAAAVLLTRWPALSPQLRGPALALLLRRPQITRLVLEAMATGDMNPAVIGIDRRVRLLRHVDEGIRTQAVKLFGGAISANRRQIAEQYRTALTMSASAHAGEVVFKRTCAKCHRVDGQGFDVGPDISDVLNRSREALLYDILDPNRTVEPQFTEYVILTTDGRVLHGLMVSESMDTVVLGQADGKQQVVARTEIDELRASGKSLMPEGVEKDISIQQMADLLEYLANRAGPPG